MHETQFEEKQHSLDSTLLHLGTVISNHLLDLDYQYDFTKQGKKTYTLLDVPLGLPLKSLFGSGSIGPSSLGVIGRDLLVDDVDPLGEWVTLLLLDLLDNVLHVSSAVVNRKVTLP
jgi:hypothetical protein